MVGICRGRGHGVPSPLHVLVPGHRARIAEQHRRGGLQHAYLGGQGWLEETRKPTPTTRVHEPPMGFNGGIMEL